MYAVRSGPHIANNIIADIHARWGAETLEYSPYEPQRDFLMLLNTGDGGCIGGKMGFTFKGKWVWNLKDNIDRMFMRLYSAPELLGEAAFAKYTELVSAGTITTPEAYEQVTSLVQDPDRDYSV